MIDDADHRQIVEEIEYDLQKYKRALEKIKAVVEREPCSIIGAYNLRQGVKEVLSEVEL